MMIYGIGFIVQLLILYDIILGLMLGKIKVRIKIKKILRVTIQYR